MDTVTTAPVTTKPKVDRGPLAKHWAGCTLNNYTAVDEAVFQTRIRELADYFIYGKEVGDKGTPHLQFMVCFKTAKRLTALKKILDRAHWEMKSSDSTMLRASNYCKKGEQTKAEWLLDHEDGANYGKNAVFIEYGELPLDQTVKGRKVIMDHFEDTLRKAESADINSIMPEHLIKYYGTIKKIEAENKKMPDNLTWEENEQPNLWIHGDTSMLKQSKG